MSGNLTLTYSYEDTINFFTNNYPNLIINVLKGEYIRFEDKEVEKICATNWGDGTGITAAQAAAVSSIGDKFKGNKNIISFNEFKYFTNVYLQHWTYSRAGFCECSSLKYITFPTSLTFIGYQNFYLTSSIEIIIMNIKTPPTLDWNGEFAESKKCTFYVPDESVDTYKSASNWSTYSTRIKALSTFATDFPNG